MRTTARSLDSSTEIHPWGCLKRRWSGECAYDVTGLRREPSAASLARCETSLSTLSICHSEHAWLPMCVYTLEYVCCCFLRIASLKVVMHCSATLCSRGKDDQDAQLALACGTTFTQLAMILAKILKGLSLERCASDIVPELQEMACGSRDSWHTSVCIVPRTT